MLPEKGEPLMAGNHASRRVCRKNGDGVSEPDVLTADADTMTEPELVTKAKLAVIPTLGELDFSRHFELHHYHRIWQVL
jgi:hypothetical protein